MLQLSCSSEGTTLEGGATGPLASQAGLVPTAHTAHLLGTCSVTCFLVSPDSPPHSLLVLPRIPSQGNYLYLYRSPCLKVDVGEPNLRQFTDDTI